VQPCFYHDISVDIPLEFQKVVRTIFYLWLGVQLHFFRLPVFYVNLSGNLFIDVSIVLRVQLYQCRSV